MRRRDLRQALIAGFGEFVILPAENLLRSRSAQRFVRLIHLRQQSDVARGVTSAESPAPALPASHRPAFGVLADQPRYLRPTQACHFPDVPFHQTFAAPMQTAIALRTQRLLRPLIQLCSIWGFEFNFFVAGQKCPDLFQTQVFAVLHAD